MKVSLNNVRRHMRDNWAWLVVFAMICSPITTASAKSYDSSTATSMAREVQRAISEWDYEEAASMAPNLLEMFPDHWAVQYAVGRLRFHQGAYNKAIDLLAAAATSAPASRKARIKHLGQRVATTDKVVEDYEVFTTPDGLFNIRYQGPRDSVLMPWAAETLEAAYYEIGYSTGYWPKAPIRVEIYPRADILAKVSSLSLEAVETTSTIGLCKYNKLMFASPRSAVRGYGWRDTLAHEYTHLVISRMTGNRVPVWLHEALAKYLESRWRGHFNMRLEPSREDLLTERIAKNDLVTFEEMHPSIAMLPSQEDATVAYAEVFTVIEYLVQRRGHHAIRQLLAAIRDGKDVQGAFAAVVGESWDVFKQNWMRWLKNEREKIELPGDFEPEIQLAGTEEGITPAEEDLVGLEQPKARDYLELGQLLRGRGQLEASIAEYRKAESILGAYNPMVQSSMAKALVELRQFDAALQAVDKVRQWYPSYYLSELYRGEALNALEHYEEALTSFTHAVGVNPFDPRVHEGMAVAYRALGNQKLAERASMYAELVDRGSSSGD